MSLPTDVLFNFLHGSIIDYFNQKGPNKDKYLKSLELIGFRAGQALVEKISKDWPRFKDELDIIKFICKEYWTQLFHKQIDNLKTNHQGVYVLQDNEFMFFNIVSSEKIFLEECVKYLALPCGLIRGALHQLGIASIVTSEIEKLPACKFQIELHKL